MMRLYAYQWDVRWEDKPANFARVRELVASDPPVPGSVLVLPELFATGFSMSICRIAERPGDITASFLGELAALYKVYVLAGLAQLAPTGRGLNLAVIFGPEGAQLNSYQKIHPLFGPEERHYEPGDRIVLVQCHECRLAPFICFDLRFPEIFREAVQRGAQVLAVLANFPSVREAHWLALLQARAIENQCYVVGVNRCGRDPQQEYPGRSLIIDPWGKIVADAGNREGAISVTLDLERQARYRAEFPVLDSIRQGDRPAPLRGSSADPTRTGRWSVPFPW